ncbi:MFS transporter [Vibrio sp. MA64]|uniref:MFS transporter n=1 Tax=Vibrio sp. MA64 TaxID=2896365 RepID=UPI001E48F49F|nr:MFS transporter [Vibrio sp. MA64]MCC9650185.1 MFS transporter [Vibrio sp. MA64]
MPQKLENIEISNFKRFLLFALYSSTLFCVLAAASVPTPLYPHYQEVFNFSNAMLTIIFAAYAISLLATLLISGSISDYIGRKVVISIALALQIISMWWFYASSSVFDLIIARLLQGAATGLATSALGAVLVDLDKRLGGTIAVASSMLGLSSGVILSSLLIQFSEEPAQSIFKTLIIVYLLQGFLVLIDEERISKRAGVLYSLQPKINISTNLKDVIKYLAPVNMVGWALCGFYLALMPLLNKEIAQFTTPFINSFLIFVLPFTGGLTSIYFRNKESIKSIKVASFSMFLGIISIILGALTENILWLFTAGILSGIGFGAGFLGTQKSMLERTEEFERSGTISLFYIISYLPFSIPVVLAGVSIQNSDLITTTIFFSTILSVICLWVAFKSYSFRKCRMP